MKIVLAPQALKGSLDAPAVAEAMATGAHAVYPTADVVRVPVADGGEGTVVALVAATGGTLHTAAVVGPLGETVAATFGILGNAADGQRTAVIEMAAASGLPLVAPEQRDPRRATTYGTGQLIRAALDSGCNDLLIGIGGSATNDGGAGMAQALGARLLDAAGAELPWGGAALASLDRIDTAQIDPRLRQVSLRLACDVTNPLTGPEGASAVYGPQKGASAATVRELDAALRHYAALLRRDCGADVEHVPGAGAAGGLGAGLLAFTHATLTPGADLVLRALDIATHLRGASVVLTAEGRLDRQTLSGKAVGAVARAARAAGVPVIALAGSIDADAATLAALGIEVALPLADGPLSLEESMRRAAELVTAATQRALALVALGQRLAE